MNKIEEIIEKNRLHTDHYADQEFVEQGIRSITSAMIEYAEWYAKKCLEIASEKALMSYEHLATGEYELTDEYYTEDENEMNVCIRLHKDSILNIELPDHD